MNERVAKIRGFYKYYIICIQFSLLYGFQDFVNGICRYGHKLNKCIPSSVTILKISTFKKIIKY